MTILLTLMYSNKLYMSNEFIIFLSFELCRYTLRYYCVNLNVLIFVKSSIFKYLHYFFCFPILILQRCVRVCVFFLFV